MEEEEVQVTPLDSALMLEQAELVNLLLDHQAITMDRIYNIAATRIQVNTQLLYEWNIDFRCEQR